MNNLKITIRVNSSLEVVSGHVMSCISLVDELANRVCVLITHAQMGDISAFTKKGYELLNSLELLKDCSVDVVRVLVNWRGTTDGVNAAEAFVLGRNIE